jgi:hypothetical protein
MTRAITYLFLSAIVLTVACLLLALAAAKQWDFSGYLWAVVGAGVLGLAVKTAWEGRRKH